MDEKEKLIEKIGRQALEYDRDYSGCSQSVLKAIQDNLDIGDENSFKSATVLSGGIARRGEYCGALIGALMAYSLAEGRERMEDFEVYSKACGVANEICEEFKEKVGSTICSEIQEKMYGRSFDLRKADDYQAFLDAGGHNEEGCPKICGIAAELAARKILEKK